MTRISYGTPLSAAMVAVVLGCATELEPPRVASITVTPGTATLDFIGQSTVFTASVKDQYGSDFTGTVRWTSDAPAVFTVSSAGVAAAVSNGTGTVRAELGGISGTANVLVSQTPTAVERVAGDAQRGPPQRPLTELVVARVLDAAGHPIAETAVAFSPVEGSGVVAPGIAPTDRAGEARATWTLGEAFGPQSLVASVADGPNTVFTATALRPNALADSVAILSGDDQAARPGKALRRPVVVRVLDQRQMPVDGATVLFAAPAGHGSADPDSVRSDSRGEAATTWTLGDKIGLQLLTASVPMGASVRVLATGTEGVCGRTPQIEDALMRAAGVSECAAVTDAVLSRIDELYWGALGITRLAEGDLAGLSGLSRLALAGNRLEELPPGVFADLSNLQYLDLWHNLLTDLPPGIFADLVNLQTLRLLYNRLTDLPPGVFTGLSDLKKLNLGANQLSLRPDFFVDLPNLEYLDLGSAGIGPQPQSGTCRLASSRGYRT